MNRSSNKNAEMMARPGMAISLASAAFEHGGKELVKGNAKKAIADVTSFFTEGPGKGLLSASKVLNLGKSGTASRSDVKEAVHSYVKVLQKEDSEAQKALVALVASAGKLYLLGMHLIEQKAFLTKLGGWAKKWKRAGQEPPVMRSWLKEPSNASKLEAALVDLIMEKAKGNKQKNRDDSSGSKASRSSSSKSRRKRSDSSASRASRGDSEDRRRPKREKQLRRERSKSKGRKDDKDKERRRRSSSPSRRKPAKKAAASKSRKRRSSSNKSRRSTKLSPKRSPDVDAAWGEEKRRKRRPEAAATPKAPASVKASGSELGLHASDQESESGEQTPSEEQVLKQWDAADADSLSNEVAAGIANIDNKQKRLSLSALVSLLDNIPDDVLKLGGLYKAREELKKFSRMPRKEKVEQLLQKMDTLCAKRQKVRADDGPDAAITVSIHRVGAVSKDGRASVKDGDPVDKVQMDADATLGDVLTAFFKAQGSSEDRGNWSVKSLDDDHMLRDVEETTCVAECRRIALLRKGG
eukprot:Skav207749  [mRNA]  locus=scaffold181:49729:51303:- [translate_table: standard]